jgi:hypothetical protein
MVGAGITDLGNVGIMPLTEPPALPLFLLHGYRYAAGLQAMRAAHNRTQLAFLARTRDSVARILFGGAGPIQRYCRAHGGRRGRWTPPVHVSSGSAAVHNHRPSSHGDTQRVQGRVLVCYSWAAAKYVDAC